MKIRKLAALAAAIVLIFATGCAKRETALDARKSAEAIFAALEFDDELLPVDRDTALRLYGADEADVANVYAYMSSGATSEEISVWEAKDSDAAARLMILASDRAMNQRELYADYRPAEAERLDGAVIWSGGKYVILTVAPDAQAADEAVRKVVDGEIGK